MHDNFYSTDMIPPHALKFSQVNTTSAVNICRYKVLGGVSACDKFYGVSTLIETESDTETEK